MEACLRVFAGGTRWTAVRGSDLEEGESQGACPVWSRHVGDPLPAGHPTRRVDFALFTGEALTDDTLVRETPAIVDCRAPAAFAHTGGPRGHAPPGRKGAARFRPGRTCRFRGDNSK
ncbi:hypothetical protein ABZ918_07945 [Streptomyces viridosporus]|uniref:hypothetical protein n=1 Tax=Streptomyces viridosporus TaxID=67581 RepID=UPI00341802FA